MDKKLILDSSIPFFVALVTFIVVKSDRKQGRETIEGDKGANGREPGVERGGTIVSSF